MSQIKPTVSHLVVGGDFTQDGPLVLQALVGQQQAFDLLQAPVHWLFAPPGIRAWRQGTGVAPGYWRGASESGGENA